jgi:hypothetical protein
MNVDEFRKQLKRIEQHVDIYSFAELRDGKVTEVLTGKTVPKKHINKKCLENRNDGFYRLCPYTCDGTCEIGKPAEKCQQIGIDVPAKCGKYFLETIGVITVDIDRIVALLARGDD